MQLYIMGLHQEFLVLEKSWPNVIVFTMESVWTLSQVSKRTGLCNIIVSFSDIF
jgi:hypothetical protein